MPMRAGGTSPSAIAMIADPARLTCAPQWNIPLSPSGSTARPRSV